MARLRAPSNDHDIDEPPPRWLARKVYIHRVAGVDSDRPGDAGRLLFNVRDLNAAIATGRRSWEALTPEARSRLWRYELDPNVRPAQGTEDCPDHHQPWSYCEATCPTVRRHQRDAYPNHKEHQ